MCHCTRSSLGLRFLRLFTSSVRGMSPFLKSAGNEVKVDRYFYSMLVLRALCSKNETPPFLFSFTWTNGLGSVHLHLIFYHFSREESDKSRVRFFSKGKWCPVFSIDETEFFSHGDCPWRSFGDKEDWYLLMLEEVCFLFKNGEWELRERLGFFDLSLKEGSTFQLWFGCLTSPDLFGS